MHGYAICQRNHPQELIQLGHKHPMANPPILRLHFFAHGSGDSCMTPLHANTVTTLLFECKSIPLYFILASCRLKQVCKPHFNPPPPAVRGGLMILSLDCGCRANGLSGFNTGLLKNGIKRFVL